MKGRDASPTPTAIVQQNIEYTYIAARPHDLRDYRVRSRTAKHEAGGGKTRRRRVAWFVEQSNANLDWRHHSKWPHPTAPSTWGPKNSSRKHRRAVTTTRANLNRLMSPPT